MKQLPKTIYVAWRDIPNDDPYLDAHDNPVEAIEDDGPTIVGTYQLVSEAKMDKVARATTIRRGRKNGS